MRRILDSPAADRYPALAARAWWALAVVLMRDAKLEEGRRAAMASRDLYARLGEKEYQASMIGLVGEAANLIGDQRGAYEAFREALHTVRDYPLSVWRHNALVVLSRAAAADGYSAAAEVVNDEIERGSRAANTLTAVVESHLARAANARSVSPDLASAAVAEGFRVASRLPAGNARTQLEHELTLLKVQLSATRTAEDSTVFDAAIAYFGRARNFSKLQAAHLARAKWRLRAGDSTGGEADLQLALGIFEDQRANITDFTERRRLSRQAQGVGDVLSLLRIARGDAAGAWRVRERARGAHGTPGDATRSSVVVEMAVIGDTLVLLMSRHQPVAFRETIDAEAMRVDIERLNLALERGGPESVWGPLAEELHARLLAPLGLTAADSIVTIIADQTLNRVPFAALRGSPTSGAAAGLHAFRFASSLQQASTPRRRIGGVPRTLLVGDVPVDRRAFPGLTTLAGAGREIDSLARRLPRAHTLRGRAADTTAVKSQLPQADIFHFAGHAVFDDARPERSQLVVGSRGLTVESIRGLDLSRLKLVVLSACETDRTPAAASTGFLGLADSFIAAGADGVIGSLWKVDDASTLLLMQAFYDALGRTGDPVTALRDAQRSLKHLPPSTWAAFRYIGR
jgi:CHAT domain-containing protein